jgi:hypothetical protein
VLNLFFGDKPINEIEIIHLRMYQNLRSGKVRAHSVNRELGVLQQVLRENDQWARLQSRYRQLKEPPSRAAHSLTAEEEQRASTRQYAGEVYQAYVVTLKPPNPSHSLRRRVDRRLREPGASAWRLTWL